MTVKEMAAEIPVDTIRGKQKAQANRKASERTANRPSGRRLSKPWINFWIDVTLAAIFIGLCSVAAVVQFAFPPASTAAGWLLWGLSYDQFATIQFCLLCVLAAGIILHVMLHWTWVCGMLTRGRPESSLRTDDGIRTIVGVGVLIAALHVIGVVLLVAMLMIEQP